MLMRVVDIMFAFPGIVLAILIAGLLGPTRTNAMIAIGIIITPAFARVVRSAVLEVMGFPFIESARSLGANDLRIMFRHVIPNIVAPLIVLTTVYFSVGDPRRGDPQLPRPRHAAARGGVGQHARHREVLHRRERLDVDLARARRS